VGEADLQAKQSHVCWSQAVTKVKNNAATTGVTKVQKPKHYGLGIHAKTTAVVLWQSSYVNIINLH
jgi:hypothetical protein